MKRLIFLLILLLIPVGGWGGTYYSAKIAGTIYYKLDAWPTAADTSAATLQALINALDNGNHVVVLDAASAWTGADGVIALAGDNITIRTPISTDPDYATHVGTVTIGPPSSGVPAIKVATARTGITLSGAITLVGYSNYNLGTFQTYSTASNINLKRTWDNGAWQTPIIISSDNAADVPVYVFGDGTGDPSTVILDGIDARCYRVDSDGIKINIADIGTGNIVRNSTVMNYGTQAAGTIQGNGFDIIDSNGWTISDNIVGDQTHRWYRGIRLVASDNNTLSGNVVTYSWDGDDYSGGSGEGISIGTSSQGNDIYANLIQTCYEGIKLGSTSGAGGNRVHHNLVLDSPVNGVSVTNNPTDYDLVYNNTVRHRPTANAGHGLVSQISSGKVKFYYNIVDAYTTAARPHNIQCIAIADDADPSAYDVATDYNLYYSTGTAYVGELDGTMYDTLTDWQTALNANPLVIGKDAHSRFGDPKFLSATDFRLQENSPARRIVKCAASVWNGVANIVDKRGKKITDASGNCLVADIDAGPYQSQQSLIRVNGRMRSIYTP